MRKDLESDSDRCRPLLLFIALDFFTLIAVFYMIQSASVSEATPSTEFTDDYADIQYQQRCLRYGNLSDCLRSSVPSGRATPLAMGWTLEDDSR
jgi:hypothetical protein